jgi:hypothetical protein
MVSSQTDKGGLPKTTVGWWLSSQIWRDSVGMQKYSIETTAVLGKLACLVLLKILGIGTAEQTWKKVKNTMKGICTKTGIDKTTKLVAT